MKCSVSYAGKLIIKRTTVPEHVFECIRENLQQYSDWLLSYGIILPKTRVSYTDGEATFEQIFVQSDTNVDHYQIIQKILSLHYGQFGIDSNPLNFISSTPLYYVDLTPFLIRNIEVLASQFNYDVQTVLQRYFTRINVAVSFINRVALHNLDAAADLALNFRKQIYEDYDIMLPREKSRLLQVISKSKGYSDYYLESKPFISIDKEENITLLKMLGGKYG